MATSHHPPATGFRHATLEIAGQPATVVAALDDPDVDALAMQAARLTSFATLLDRLEPGATIIDVGARTGLSTMVAARIARAATVIAVEPVARRAEGLRRAIGINRLSNARCLRALPAPHLGHGAARLDGETGDCLRGPDPGIDDPDRVLCTPLDLLIASLALPRVDFVKLDCSGFEAQVLLGTSLLRAAFDPAFLVFHQPYSCWKNGAGDPHATARFAIATYGAFRAYTTDGEIAVTSDSELAAFIEAHEKNLGRADWLAFGGGRRPDR